MSDGFVLMWGKMLRSSVWVKESKETRLVWMTLLMMKDFEGKVLSSVVGLAYTARVSDEECRQALAILLAPDPNDTSKVEDGRRIRVIPGGWEIVNHDLYRFSTDAKRELWREQKAKQREQKKEKRKGPLRGERQYVAAVENGASEKTLDKIVTDSLPPT